MTARNMALCVNYNLATRDVTFAPGEEMEPWLDVLERAAETIQETDTTCTVRCVRRNVWDMGPDLFSIAIDGGSILYYLVGPEQPSRERDPDAAYDARFDREAV